nr:cupin domain-containing protein [uncultured Desulfuromonas sp.]
MASTIIRTAEQDEYDLADHPLFFVRDVVTKQHSTHLSLHRGRIEPGGEITPHRQEHTETIYILSGDVECVLDDDTCELGAGTCLVIEPHTTRGLKNIGDQPVELLVVFTPPLT